MTCNPDRLVCAVRDLIDAINGDPLPDFLLTALATLFGAVVGALAAWLFSLDLRRREKEDREAERAQAKADREAERRSEHEARVAERQEDRRMRAEERREERDHQQALTMKRQWLSLEDLISRFYWGEHQVKVELYPQLSAAMSLTGSLSTGDDREVFDALNDNFTIKDFEGESGAAVGAILAVYARDGMPKKFAIQQLLEAAKERDAEQAAAKASRKDAEASE